MDWRYKDYYFVNMGYWNHNWNVMRIKELAHSIRFYPALNHFKQYKVKPYRNKDIDNWKEIGFFPQYMVSVDKHESHYIENIEFWMDLRNCTSKKITKEMIGH